MKLVCYLNEKFLNIFEKLWANFLVLYFKETLIDSELMVYANMRKEIYIIYQKVLLKRKILRPSIGWIYPQKCFVLYKFTSNMSPIFQFSIPC
jgi:hypothetical protein